MKVLAIVAISLAAGMGQQERAPSKLPQKGDTIVVTGCLKGLSLEATETALLDSEAKLATALVYRLTGDKNLLKQMRQEFDGKVIDATGVLKSTLPPAAEVRGTTVGRTRITIGVGSSQVGSGARAEANRSIPVLEVKSYEGKGLDMRCGG